MKSSQYIARKPDSKGVIHYSNVEHDTWQTLYTRQMKVLPERACSEFLDGLKLLGLSSSRIPQLSEVNSILGQATGWSVARVPALISFDRFFKLLSERQFPVATFIRTPEELDYLEEPDIFHEIFGHCPLLTNSSFAALTEMFGRIGLKASKEERVYIARLYWMTVEFGLINTEDGLRIYGGGILSSYRETLFCLGAEPVRPSFEVDRMLRTPYRIDILQPLYFVIQSMTNLDELCQMELMEMVQEAMGKPLYPALFKPKTM